MTCSSFCLGIHPSEYSHHHNHYTQNLLCCLSQSGAPKHSPIFWLELTKVFFLGYPAEILHEAYILVQGLFSQTNGTQVSGQPLTSCLILGKLFNLSKLDIPNL